MCFCQNKELLPVRFIYFSILAGMSCFIPYATLYSSHLGLTPSQVGLIWGLEPLIQFVSAPLWGSAADKYSKHKQIFLTSLLCTSGLYLSLLFIPPVSPVETSIEDVTGNCSTNLNIDVSGASLECLSPESGLNKVSFSLGPEIEGEFCSTLCSNYPTDVYNSLYVCDVNSIILYCDACVRNSQDAVIKFSQESNGTLTVVPLSVILACKENDSRTGMEKFENTSGLPPKSCDHLKCCNCQAFQYVNGKDPGNLMLTFSLCMLLVLLASIFHSIQMPFVNAVCFGLLRGRIGDFGKQRLWGAVGWGVFSFVSGVAVDKYNKKFDSERTLYNPIFYMYVSFMALTFLFVLFMRFPPHESAKSMRRNMWLLLKKLHVIAFFGLVAVIGIAYGITGAFLFLFMDEMKSTYLIMGLSQTIATSAEIPCFFVSGKVIKQLGHNGVFCLTLLAFFVRLLGYSLAPNPFVVLPFQILHGITFALFWAAASSYATIIAPKGMVATLQTIINGLHFGIGKAVGTAFAGVVYEELGSRNLFRGIAGLCLAALFIYLPILCCLGTITAYPIEQNNDQGDEHGKNGERGEDENQAADNALQEKMLREDVDAIPNVDMQAHV